MRVTLPSRMFMLLMRVLTRPMEIDMAGEHVNYGNQSIADDTASWEDKREHNRDQADNRGYDDSTIDRIGEVYINRLATGKQRVTTTIPPVQGDHSSDNDKMQAIDNQYNFLLRLIDRIKTIS